MSAPWPGRRDLARQAILAANLYPEGRWVFAPVRSADDLEDVRRPLGLKMGNG